MGEESGAAPSGPHETRTSAAGLTFVRYGLPALLILAGLVCLFVVDSGSRVAVWSMFTGAGLAVLLLNLLHRFGVSGDVERDREAEARRYFDEHGRWPEEEERAGRRWRLPENVVMPEPPGRQDRPDRKS